MYDFLIQSGMKQGNVPQPLFFKISLEWRSLQENRERLKLNWTSHPYNMNQQDALFSPIYFSNNLLHVTSRLAAHHQEDQLCINSNWYMS
jgi:hypothetical protein